MKKLRRFLAMLLVVVLVLTNNNSIVQVLATNTSTPVETAGEGVDPQNQDTDSQGDDQSMDEPDDNQPAGDEEDDGQPAEDEKDNGQPAGDEPDGEQPQGDNPISDTPQPETTPIPGTASVDETLKTASNTPSATSTEGTNIELTAKLIVDSNKTVVKAGESFQYQLEYTIPTQGAGSGGSYTGTKFMFQLPQYVELVKDANGKYMVAGKDFVSIEYSDFSDKYIITLTDPLPVNETNTLTLNLKTQNLVTPNGAKLNFDENFVFQTQYQTGEGFKAMTQNVRAGEIGVAAASNWQIDKTNTVSIDGLNYKRVGDTFEVTYRVKVTDEVGVDNLGRLGFSSYEVTDVLPTNLPDGGEAQAIKDVKLVRGNTKVDTDYTIGTDAAGHPTSVTFTTPDTIQEGETSQYLSVGDVTNTTYEYTVVYPYEPYTTKANETVIKEWELTNTVTLDYTLIGNVSGSDSDFAKVNIAAYEDAVETTDLTIQKWIKLGDEEHLLDSTWAEKYGAAGDNTLKFTLYMNPECTQIAYNTLKQPMTNIALGSDGTAKFTSLRDGEYYIQESNEMTGFLGPAAKKVIIADQKATFEDGSDKIVNVASAVNAVEFTKKGDDAYGNTSQNLAGATFTLTKGEDVYTATSDANGKVRFDQIPDGTYVLQETAISDELKGLGYEVSAATYSVTVKGGEVSHPALSGDNVFKNISDKGLLTITKVDSKNPDIKLSGAVFEAYGPYHSEAAAQAAIANPENKAATLTTNADGVATSGALTQGFYILKEVKAPANHTSGAPRVVEVTKHTTQSVTIENDPQAHVFFRKRGAASAESMYKQELAGVTFQLFDENGTQLYGKKDADGNYTDVSTDATGREKVVITTRLDATNKSVSNYAELSPGTYQYQEISVPEPYVASETKVEFTVASVSPSNDEEAWKTTQTYIVDNYLEYGQIRVVKDAKDVDETSDDAATVMAAVNGAQFGVYPTKADAEAGTNLMETITTGTAYAEGTDGSDSLEYGVGYSVTQLELGKTYYVKETKAPGGYALNQTVFEATPDSGTKQVVVTCVNEPTVSIQLTKVDSHITTKKLKGVTFALYKSNTEGSQPVATAKTDSNGVVTFGDLDPDTTYYYKETATIDGYVLDSEFHAIQTESFSDGGDGKTEETVTNDRLAKVNLSKKNTAGKAMKDVTFRLFKVTDSTQDILADTNNLTGAIATKKTSSSGAASFDNLEPGNYWLVETVPSGYDTGKANGTVVTEGSDWKVVTVGTKEYFYKQITVHAGDNKGEGYDSPTENITNIPTKGKIKLTKVVANALGTIGQNPTLAGVQFTVYTDAACTQVKAVLSDTNSSGQTTSDWLEPGTYYIRETKTPDGYVATGTAYEVTVTAGQTTSTVKAVGAESSVSAIVNYKKGGFTLNKYAAYKVDGTAAETKEPLQGAVFTLYSYDAANDAEGGKPALADTPAADKFVKTIDMSLTATTTVTGLEPGTYWLRETRVPEGFDAAADSLIKINWDGTTEYGTIAEDGTITYTTAGSNTKVDVKNYSENPRIRLIKVAFGDESTRLDNAKFEVYVDDAVNGTETVIDGETVKISPLTVGAQSPFVIVSGTAINPENASQKLTGQALTPDLQAGHTYYFKEIQAPAGYHYDVNDPWVSVTIPANATGEFQVEAVNYADIQAPGVKENEKHDKLSGAVLAVFHSQTDAQAMVDRLKTDYNEAVEKEKAAEGQKYRLTADEVTANKAAWNIDEITTSNAGVFKFQNLIPGQIYYIVELVAPTGYQLDRNSSGNYFYYEVKVAGTIYDKGGAPFEYVKKDGTLTGAQQLTITNYERHQIWLDKKVILSGAEYWVSGATFTIYGSTAAGEPDPATVIGTMGISTIPGRYLSELLPQGTYWLAETVVPDGLQEAPNRDVLNGSVQDSKVVNNVRYYKVELGRTSDNEWFKEHPVYNVATTGRFVLTKVDSVSDAKIAATFNIAKYNEETNAFETYADYSSITTGTTGYTLSNLMTPGLYKLTETSVTGDYTMSTEPIYIRIEAEKITDGTVTATEEVNGVSVTVYQPTDTAAKEDQDADSTDDPVLTNAIVVNNVPKGRFYIHKTGTWNGGSSVEMNGVSFAVYARFSDVADGAADADVLAAFTADTTGANAIKTITTTNRGNQAIADSGLLDAGKYWVMETGIADTALNAEYGKTSYIPQAVTVAAGQTSKVTANTYEVENISNYGKFTVSKVDSVDNTPITGVTFQIYKNDVTVAENLVGTMTDNGDGTYTSPKLDPTHAYYLKETAVPDNYTINAGNIYGPYSVTANSLNTVAEAITNEHDKSLTINKYELNGTVKTDTMITAAATFALYTTQEEAAAAAADNLGTPVRGLTSTSGGTFTWDNLPNGIYYLREFSAPENYLLQSTVDAEDAANVAPNVYEIVINDKSQNSYAYTKDVYNLKKGGFELQKVINWKENGTTTQIAGTNIQFKLYRGTTAEEANLIDTLTTDDTGKISYRLPAGDYLLVEVLDGYYTKDTTQYSAPTESGNYIDADGVHVRIEASVINTEFTGDHSIVNTSDYGRFKLAKLAKTGGTDKGLNGAEYKLEKLVDGTWVQVGTENIAVNDSDWVAGVYESGLLPTGTYRVKEMKAPLSVQNDHRQDVNFTIDPTPIEFDILSGETVGIQQYDGIYRNLEVTKTTDSKNGSGALAGVTFELYKASSTAAEGKVSVYNNAAEAAVLDAYKDGGNAATAACGATTGDDGKVTFTDLLPGKYLLVETVVPVGYEKQAVVLTIAESTTYNDLVQTYELQNASEQGRILIRKENMDGTVITRDSANNAVFQIFNLTDTELTTPLDTVTVGNTGIGTSSLLPIGEYWVVETKAPTDYTLDDRLTIRKKKVAVSGDQNPTVDFTGISAANTEGYTDKVIFQNRTWNSIDITEASIDKWVKIKDQGAYDTEHAASAESLMYQDVTAEFKITDLTNVVEGYNEIPMQSFVVTDDTLKFYDKSGNTIVGLENPTSSDYVMHYIALERSVNQNAESIVSAKVFAKVDTKTAEWQEVQTISDLSSISEAVKVTLPENTVGFKVEYGNTDVGFDAGDIFFEVTLKQRNSDADMAEVRKISNTANLSWEDTAKDNTGAEKHKSGTVDDTVNITFQVYNEELPIIGLTNEIVNRPGSGMYYSGGTVDFETVGSVVQTSPVDLKHPVMSINLPAYTTLDTTKHPESKAFAGIRATTNDGTVLDFTYIKVIEKDDLGREYEKYVLDFGEDFVLKVGDSIKLQYTADISLSVPAETISLTSYGFIGSGHQLPLTLENPTGMSYSQSGSDSSTLLSNDSAFDAGLKELGNTIDGDILTYLRRPVSIELTRSNSLILQKSVKTEDTDWTRTDVPTVKPADNYYYKLTLVNGGDAVKRARIVDILPFDGDTMEFRARGSNSISSRSTDLPFGEGYEQVQLVAVNPESVEGAAATVYYYVENEDVTTNVANRDWTTANRAATTAEAEFPMLTSKGSAASVWTGNWTTSPSDMSKVTAIGVEVVYDEEHYMQSGDTFSVQLTMRAPGYTAEQMQEYEDAIIANTSAATVTRSYDTDESVLTAIDRVSSNEVKTKLYITTGSIGDYAFYDTNDNGIQDLTDIPARNIPVTLYRKKSTASMTEEAQWEVYKTTTTDQTTGYYEFTELPCNYLDPAAEPDPTQPVDPDDYVGNTYYEYKVEFGIPEGYAATIRYADNQLGEYDNRSNSDSNIDANGQTESVTLSLTVGADGKLMGEENPTIDAGYVKLVNLGDYVWIDTNKNGIQDETEEGLNGVTVNLYKVDSMTDTIEDKEPYRTQLTGTKDGNNGYYCFTDLPKGYYVVEFDISQVEKPEGGYTEVYEFTTSNAGSDGADSDAQIVKNENPGIMYTTNIHLTEDDMTWDAGVTVYSALGGFVFDDQDYNDTQSIEIENEDGEKSTGIPLPGTVVTLYKVSEDGTMDPEPVGQQTVGEDGRYLFAHLDEGRYKVHFDYPDEYIGVKAGVGDYLHDSETKFFDDDTLNSGFTDIIELPADTQDLTHDAGAYLLSSIGDYVWEDMDKDGIQDSTEKPVEGIIVTLQQKTGEDGEWTTMETTATDENGLYLFEGLKSSDHYDVEYRVAFGVPRTVDLTADNQGDDEAADSNALPEYDINLGYFTAAVKPPYGEDDMTIDAGLYYRNAVCEVGDYVWYDVDQDGIQDENETGVEGIVVLLEYCTSGDVWDDDAWETVGTTKTDANGKYIFTGLPAGAYRVAFGVGDPWTVTLSRIGDPVKDSDAVRVKNGYYYSSAFYLNDGDSDMTWDAGIYKISERETITNTIVNYVYYSTTGFVYSVATGDPASIGLLLAMLIASGGILVFLIRKRRNRA